MREQTTEFVMDLDGEEADNGREALVRFRDFNDDLTTVLPTYADQRIPTDRYVRKLAFLEDNKIVCRFPFKNGVVEIAAENVTKILLTDLKPNVLWESQVIPREISLDSAHDEASDKGQFGQFLAHVIQSWFYTELELQR